MNTTTPPPKPQNKPKNQFAALPEADRKFILDLCSKTPYDQAVVLLRRPRSEGGLNIITSRSALSRFFTSAQPESDQALLAQIAAAANIRHEQQSNAFLGAIRAAIQARVLEHLNSGRALADMQHDFKLLRTAESLYLADANFRAKHPKTARASYKDYVQHCAEAPDTDFLPADEAPSGADHNTLPDPTQLDRDIQKERDHQQEILTLFKSRRSEDPNFRENQILSALNSARSIPPENPPKTPAIPHFPPNPTKQESSPANTPEPKPKPYIAPPKPGRNDPCPCGSGRKSKKCCHP